MGSAGGGSTPLPDPLDVSQMNEEAISRYIIDLEVAKSSVQVRMTELITRASDTKRDLEIAKSQIRYCEQTIKSCQSVLRTTRPY